MTATTIANGTSEAFIVDAVRTPLGRLGGALAGVRPDDLLGAAVRAIVERSPSLDPASIDEVYAATPMAGEDNRNVAAGMVLADCRPRCHSERIVCGAARAILRASRTVAAAKQTSPRVRVESMTRYGG